jgi:hypothetical protein
MVPNIACEEWNLPVGQRESLLFRREAGDCVAEFASRRKGVCEKGDEEVVLVLDDDGVLGLKEVGRRHPADEENKAGELHEVDACQIIRAEVECLSTINQQLHTITINQRLYSIKVTESA